MFNIFVTVRDNIGYLEKIWGYLQVHKGYLPVYFKEYCYRPPSRQASTIHGYFVSATPLTDVWLLLIHCLMFFPNVCLFSVFGSCFVMYNSVPSLVLQSSCQGRWSWLLYLVVLPMSELFSVALSNVTVTHMNGTCTSQSFGSPPPWALGRGQKFIFLNMVM